MPGSRMFSKVPIRPSISRSCLPRSLAEHGLQLAAGFTAVDQVDAQRRKIAPDCPANFLSARLREYARPLPRRLRASGCWLPPLQEMRRPSRMGTPLPVRMLKVRVKRAVLRPRLIFPMTGIGAGKVYPRAARLSGFSEHALRRMPASARPADYQQYAVIA